MVLVLTKRIALLILALVVSAIPALAQSTVTGTIVDASSQPFVSGTYNFVLGAPGGYAGPFFVNGTQLTQGQINISGNLDGSGAFSQSMYANSAVTPVGSLWRMQFCPAATSTCYAVTLNITGSEDVSASVTPPTIQVPAQNYPRLAAYSDAEIIGPLNGITYLNLLTGIWRGYYNGAWHDIAGGSGGGCTATAGQVLASLTGPNLCGGVPGFTADSSGDITISPSPSGSAPLIVTNNNTSEVDPTITSNAPTGGLALQASSADNLGNGDTSIAATAIEVDPVGQGGSTDAISLGAFLEGANVANDEVYAAEIKTSMVNSTGTAAESSGVIVRTPADQGSPVVTTRSGVHIEDQSGATVTTRAAILLDDQTASGAYAIKTGTGLVSFGASVTAVTSIKGATYLTATNCSSAASPAVCSSAASGSVALPTGTNPTLQVNTSAVTANSQIMLTVDESLGTKLGVTCNTTLSTLLNPVVTARSAGASFTFTIGAIIAGNPVCVSYIIIN